MFHTHDSSDRHSVAYTLQISVLRKLLRTTQHSISDPDYRRNSFMLSLKEQSEHIDGTRISPKRSCWTITPQTWIGTMTTSQHPLEYYTYCFTDAKSSAQSGTSNAADQQPQKLDCKFAWAGGSAFHLELQYEAKRAVVTGRNVWEDV